MDWQRSLRRSTGEVQKAKPPIIRRQKRLNSIQEDVFDENLQKPSAPRGDPSRRRLSTKGSVSDVDQVVVPEKVKTRKPSIPRSPTKKEKALSFLRPLPPINLDQEPRREDVPSPIPLPPGVTNIDPPDDSMLVYGREMFDYVCYRDGLYRMVDGGVSEEDPKFEARREHLIEWLISVAHHFKCSQETLYHTIDILDRCMNKSKFKPEYIQLLGITAFLLATKLDEYYPADIEKLCHLTEDAFKPDMVRSMELRILELLDFNVYGVEPMAFIQRFLIAAFRSRDIFVYELSILFMDIMSLKFCAEKTHKKAAVAVFTALVIMDNSRAKSIEDIWTPNMKYYAWPDYRELLDAAKLMSKTLLTIFKDTNRDFSLTVKYASESRHHGLLLKLKSDRVKRAVTFLDSL